MEVAAEQALTERTEHMAQIARLEGNLFELKGKSYFWIVAILSVLRGTLS